MRQRVKNSALSKQKMQKLRLKMDKIFDKLELESAGSSSVTSAEESHPGPWQLIKYLSILSVLTCCKKLKA